jgi:hypothetical protein
MTNCQSSFVVSLTSAVLLLTPLARAAEPSDAAEPTAPPAPAHASHSFELAARLGLAVPMGHFIKPEALAFAGTTLVGPSESLSDAYSTSVPIAIDAGYRVLPGLMLGIYGQYAFVSGKSGNDGCPAQVSCLNRNAHDIAFGIQGQYHLLQQAPIDPWLGLGFGYEFLTQNGSVPPSGTVGATESYPNFSGPQLLELQGGLNFKAGDVVALGPFLSFSLGEFTSASIGGSSQSVSPKALHEWLTVGVKGTLGLGG